MDDYLNLKNKYFILLIVVGIFFLCSCKTQKEISKPSEEGQTASTNTGSQPAGSDNVLKDTANPPKNFMDSILSGYTIYKVLDGEYYTYKMIDSVPYILQKVFPGVQFIKITQGIVHSSNVYSTYYNGKSYGSYGCLNELTSVVGTSQMDLQDKVLALVLLFEGIEKSVRIDEIIADPQYSSKITCHPNYKIRAFVDNREVFYYLEVTDGKFINMVIQEGIGYTRCLEFN